ncbi:prolipoprotein diacylglyceryl transferase [Rufibacter latericius]|uniref:Phosphatidylglycerol--prolipoprotein diacylglyceryl transferase n=1 Tax=Rufibacter latericius TaxID=2487040 RepID=A0A3M9MJR3_9BACT|nr:prolipoprotein diacylglyceryl transferase [Rufibacter latericius]RNI25781.1 prolipoprotein diacylglyceryl transferase [Rufibacter latericius]
MLNFITWDVSPDIFSLGPVTVRWYGLLFAMAFVLTQPIEKYIYRKDGRTDEDVDILTMYMIIGTVIGARLGHCLFYDPGYYLSNPLEILKIWEGGLASHGGTIGILLSLYLFCRKYKFDYLWVLDRIVIVTALGGACIRLGNLMNSEIIGRPTDVAWAFKFVRNNELFNGVPAYVDPRHPTQLYESLFCVFLFILLYVLWKRGAGQVRGLLFGLFVTLLFSFRFLVEFLKENQEEFENALPLNMGQWLSIPLVLVGIAVLFYAARQPKTPRKVTA